MPTEERQPYAEVVAGGWTASAGNTYDCIDEGYSSPNDSDFVSCGVGSDITDYIEFKIQAPDWPPIPADGNMVLKMRHKAGTGGISDLTIRLLKATTIIRTVAYSNTSSYANRSFNYSKANMDDFGGDFSDIRIRLYPAVTGDTHTVSQLSLILETSENSWQLPIMKVG